MKKNTNITLDSIEAEYLVPMLDGVLKCGPAIPKEITFEIYEKCKEIAQGGVCLCKGELVDDATCNKILLHTAVVASIRYQYDHDCIDYKKYRELLTNICKHFAPADRCGEEGSTNLMFAIHNTNQTVERSVLD